MLVLGARVGEKILIADNCFVQVVERRGNKIKLGLHFPENMPVDRECRRAIKQALQVHAPGSAIFLKD